MSSSAAQVPALISGRGGRVSSDELDTSSTGSTCGPSLLALHIGRLYRSQSPSILASLSVGRAHQTLAAEHRKLILATPCLPYSGVTDVVLLQAAILHDVLEDTDSSYDELKQEFGQEVADVVMVSPPTRCALSLAPWSPKSAADPVSRLYRLS